MKYPEAIILLRLSINLFLVLFLVNCRSEVPSQQNYTLGDAAKTASLNTSPSQPQVEVFVDEAILKKPYAIIGGKVHNITDISLQNVKIDLELRRRSDESKALREVEIIPSDLEPGGIGHYSLQVLSDEWEGSKLIRVRTSEISAGLIFKTMPGAQRPPERPKPVVHIVKAPQSKTKSHGEEFINTPDTPIRVP